MPRSPVGKTVKWTDEVKSIMQPSYAENEGRIMRMIYAMGGVNHTGWVDIHALTKELGLEYRVVNDVLIDLEKRQGLIDGVEEAIKLNPAGIQAIETGRRSGDSMPEIINSTINIYGRNYGAVQQGGKGNALNDTSLNSPAFGRGEVKGPYLQKTTKERVEALFLDNVGKILTRDHIREAARDPETGKEPLNLLDILYSLRVQDGYTVLSNKDRGDLNSGEYVMPHGDRDSSGLSNYKHIKVIGEGAFSIVTLYVEEATGREVAIKVLKKEYYGHADYTHRFEREIDLLNVLCDHENIIDLIGHGIKAGRPYYIMPAASMNLHDFVSRNNISLTLEQRLSLFHQVLAAIKYAHSKDILHRDISPRNILLFESANGDIKVQVSDFGLGKDLSSDSNFTRSAAANYGQFYYVAPEQIEDLRNASIKSDIYSLGKLLDFILTGKLPATVHPTSFRTLIDRATQEDINQRYEDVEEFERSYERIKRLLVVEEQPQEAGPVKAFIKPNGTLDCGYFHRFATKSGHLSNVYNDFVGPIIDVLNEEANLKAYVDYTGDSIGDFVSVFIQRIDELPTVGWPFKATTQFGEILHDIFLLTPNLDIKLQCLKRIWRLAYEQDQYGCQRVMRHILESGSLPEELQTDFAVVILESTASISAEVFSDINIPAVIKRAITEKASEAKSAPPT